MTCKHVLALIDALPFTQSRPAQLEAVERHTRDCARCRPVLAAAKALDSELSCLPEPAPPDTLAAVIVARTVRHDEKRAAASRDASRVSPAKTRSDRPAWAALLAGVTISLGVEAYRLLVGESTLHLASPLLRGGMEGLIEMPHASPVVLVLAAGLLLYVAGLFAPPRTT